MGQQGTVITLPRDPMAWVGEAIACYEGGNRSRAALLLLGAAGIILKRSDAVKCVALRMLRDEGSLASSEHVTIELKDN